VTAEDFIKFFKDVCEDESLQMRLIQHFDHDVLEKEMRRREMIEPLMTVRDIARTLGLSESCEGLYKMLQKKELDIPYVPLGRGGGYKFDPRDVREWIRKKKIYPIKRPDSLRRRRAL
jgi:hypothetical protein